MSDKTADRDDILAEAIRLHDLKYERSHCDRKYIYSCGKLQELMLEAGQNVRNRPTKE